MTASAWAFRTPVNHQLDATGSFVRRCRISADAARGLGLRAQTRPSGARRTFTAWARVFGGPVNHQFAQQAPSHAVDESVPTRLGTPAVRFSALPQRAGRIAPRR